MNNKIVIIISVLIGLLIGGSIFVFLQTFEQKERTIHTGFLGEARTNPLYASRLFLKRMGIPSQTHESIQGFNGLPNKDTVILINSRRTSISTRQNDELIKWVKSGGHVIALATHNWRYYSVDDDGYNEESDESGDANTTNDPLQNFLGVKTDSKISYNDLSEVEQQKVDDIREKGGDFVRDSLYKIRLNKVDKEFAIMNSWFNPIIPENKSFNKNTELIALRLDNFILRQPVGNGLVTLISSLEFIENKYLYRADHAELLWHLIHGLHTSINQPKAVWLIHNDKISPLWDILWRNAWMFILSLLFLLLAWLLLKTRRFGPVIPKLDNDRRSLNEHISSSGNFYWQHDKKRQLLESSRTSLMNELIKAYPTWEYLNKQEQLKLLQNRLNVQTQSLDKTLFSESIDSMDEFTKVMQLIQVIRQSLTTH